MITKNIRLSARSHDFCPYVGLAPFDDQHRDYYFGRKLDAEVLADNVLVAPTTVLYGASGTGKTSLLNVGLPRELEAAARDMEANSVTFSPDNHLVAAGFSDRTVQVWSTKTGELVQSLRGLSGRVTSVSFFGNGARLAGATGDGVVHVWDTKKWQRQHDLKAHKERIRAIAFSPNGGTLATASRDRCVRLWRTNGFGLHGSLEGHDGTVRDVAFSPCGGQVASASSDGTVRLWNLTTCAALATFEVDGARSSAAKGDEGSGSGGQSQALAATALAFDRTGARLYCAYSDGSLRAWDVERGELLQEVSVHTHWITSLDLSGDGRLIATGSGDGTARLWNAETLEPDGPELQHRSWVRCVAFNRDGTGLATGAEDDTVRLWNLGAKADDATPVHCLRPKRVHRIVFRRWQTTNRRCALAREILQAGGTATDGLQAETISLRDVAHALHDAARRPIVIVLDQFEEYFNYAGSRHATDFERELDELASDETLDGHLLFAIRDDKYHLLDRLELTATVVLDNSIELEHLDDQAVEQAVREPIRVYNEQHKAGGKAFEVGDCFVNLLLKQLKDVETGRGRGTSTSSGEERVELPYLQLALEKIWALPAVQETNCLSARLLESGGVKKIVRDHLDETLGELGLEEQRIAAQLFERLVTPSGAKIAMTAFDLNELAQPAGGEKRVKKILEKLSKSKARIVAPIITPDDGQAYEIFHDILGVPILAWTHRQIEKEDLRESLKKKFERDRQANEQRQFRLRVLTTAGATIAALLFLAVGYVLFYQSKAVEAREATANAEQSLAEARLFKMEYLAARSLNESNNWRSVRAALLALEALPRYNRDKERPYTASAEMALWRAWQTNHEIWSRKMPGGSAVSVAFSSDMKRVAASGRNGDVRIWRVSGSEEPIEEPLGIPDLATTVAFSPDGRYLDVASSNETVHRIDLETGQAINLSDAAVPSPRPKALIALSHNELGPIAAFSTGDDDDATRNPNVRAVSIMHGKVASNVPGEKDVTSIALNSAGTLLAIATQDGLVRIESLRGADTQRIEHGANRAARALAFDPGGVRLAVSVSGERAVRVYLTSDGSLEYTVETNGSVEQIAFSEDNRTMVVGLDDGRIQVLDLVTRDRFVTIGSHDGSVRSLTVAADGMHFGSASADGTVRIWSRKSPYTSLVLAPQVVPKEGEAKEGEAADVMWSAEYSPDGRRIVGATADNRIRLWDAETGDQLAESDKTAMELYAVAFAPSGQIVVSGTATGEVVVWDAVTLARITTLSGGEGETWALSFSSDGRFAFSSEDGVVRIFDSGTFEPLNEIEAHEIAVWDVTFSPDGQFLAAASAHDTVSIWAVPPDRPHHFVGSLDGHAADVCSVVFSAKGDKIATASGDSIIRIWDAGSLELRHTLEGHDGTPYRAVFNPDGNRIASASDDATARVWDAGTGAVLAILPQPDTAEWVAFAPDGRHIAVAADNGRILVQQVFRDLYGLRAVAKSSLTRDNLTKTERQAYFLNLEVGAK